MAAVIILTALDRISDRIEGLKAGADDDMVKPLDLTLHSPRPGQASGFQVRLRLPVAG